MIGISTQIFDLEGARIFRTNRDADLKNRQGGRRVSRTATLDGGVVITDTGYVDGDRDLIIEEPQASVESVAFARYIIEHYGLVNVMTDDGAYEAAPGSYKVDDGLLTIKMMITEKISE